MKNRDVAERVARRFSARWVQGYVRWKVRSDPAYGETLEVMGARTAPLVDIGCGMGLLPFYLREGGFTPPIIGIDFDERKIEQARLAARAYSEVDFIAGDARDPLPDAHDVVMLDVLQYLDGASQQKILRNVAAVLGPGNVFVMRQGLRDDSWRHRVTRVVDAIGKIGWNRGEALTFPTREDVLAPFAGFEIDVRPLWGRTPFNNYFFVIRRPP